MNCQKCRTPLQLDNSLQDLNPAAFDLLVGQSFPLYTLLRLKSVQALLATRMIPIPNQLAWPSLKTGKTSTTKYPRMPRRPCSSESFLRLDQRLGFNQQRLLQRKRG